MANARVAHPVPLDLPGRMNTPLDAGVAQIVTRLQGETALVTGGGTGIGRAIALAFAREGANVAVAGRRLEKLEEITREIEGQGGAAISVACDVTDAKDAARAVGETAARFGGLTILVN